MEERLSKSKYFCVKRNLSDILPMNIIKSSNGIESGETIFLPQESAHLSNESIIPKIQQNPYHSS